MEKKLAKLSSCENLEDEFWYHVSSQDELPLAAAKPKPQLADRLSDIAEKATKGKVSLKELITKTLIIDPDALGQLRTLISIPDKRLYLDLSFIFSRTLGPNGQSLCGCAPSGLTRHQTSVFINILRRGDATATQAAAVIASYLLDKGLKEILEAYSVMNEAQRSAVLNCLILPKEMQQVDAKLRGHGPEAALAQLVAFLRCETVPKDKAENPMGGHDPNVNAATFEVVAKDAASTFSSDLIILDKKSGLVRICVVGLVHSSDPGQFGVDKANTVKDIRGKIDAFNAKNKGRNIEIWGLVDGVGYSENKNGTINSMLPHFHTFVQLKTLWKAALKLHELGFCKVKAIKFDSSYYSELLLEQLRKYVSKDVAVLMDGSPEPKGRTSFQAGTATIYL